MMRAMQVGRPLRHPALAYSGSLVLCACGALDVSVGAWQPDAGVAPAPEAGAADAALEDVTEAAPRTLYLEAESAALSGGFQVLDDPSASADQLLMPPADTAGAADLAPDPARAVYTFELARAGDYVLWGRIRAPTATHNRFWFSLDGAPFLKWRISVGDIWFWDDLHEDKNYSAALHFALEAGRHELVFAPAVPGVALDRLYLSAEGDEPPGNATPCKPPHSIELMGECLPSCGAQQGDRCGESACVGIPRIPAYDCDVCCRAP
jgi:hypothetical protein